MVPLHFFLNRQSYSVQPRQSYAVRNNQLESGWTSPTFQPIAYTATIAPDEEVMSAPKNGLICSEHSTVLIRHSQFSKFDFDDQGTIKLSTGDILLETTSQGIVVAAGEHLIRLAPKTVVLISKDRHTIKVCPLYESGSDSVTISSGNSNTRIYLGQEFILAEDEDSLNRALQADGIARRRTHMQSLPNNGALHRCEVSSISLIENNYLLTKLLQSSEPKDRQLANRLVKVAASLMTVTNNHGPYSATLGR